MVTNDFHFYQRRVLLTYQKVHQNLHREDSHLLQRLTVEQNVRRPIEIHPTHNSYLGESTRVRALEDRLQQLEAQIARLLAQ